MEYRDSFCIKCIYFIYIFILYLNMFKDKPGLWIKTIKSDALFGFIFDSFLWIGDHRWSKESKDSDRVIDDIKLDQ